MIIYDNKVYFRANDIPEMDIEPVSDFVSNSRVTKLTKYFLTMWSASSKCSLHKCFTERKLYFPLNFVFRDISEVNIFPTF
jgi:hypothetical protein